MGANDYVLAVYAVSGSLAIGCALLPGAGPIGRLVNILTGVGLLGWTANAYLRDGWYITNPVILLVPLLLLVYAGVTLARMRGSDAEEWFSASHRSTGSRASHAAAPARDRRSAPRQNLPGEYGNTPINQLPPLHDPWSALYASTERERIRADSLRQRLTPAPQAPAYPGVMAGPGTGSPIDRIARHAALAEAGARHASPANAGAAHAESEALVAAYTNVEAEFTAWEARCAAPQAPRESSWFDEWADDGD